MSRERIKRLSLNEMVLEKLTDNLGVVSTHWLFQKGFLNSPGCSLPSSWRSLIREERLVKATYLCCNLPPKVVLALKLNGSSYDNSGPGGIVAVVQNKNEDTQSKSYFRL